MSVQQDVQVQQMQEVVEAPLEHCDIGSGLMLLHAEPMLLYHQSCLLKALVEKCEFSDQICWPVC